MLLVVSVVTQHWHEADGNVMDNALGAYWCAWHQNQVQPVYWQSVLAETLVETCFCQYRFKPSWQKQVSARTFLRDKCCLVADDLSLEFNTSKSHAVVFGKMHKYELPQYILVARLWTGVVLLST